MPTVTSIALLLVWIETIGNGRPQQGLQEIAGDYEHAPAEGRHLRAVESTEAPIVQLTAGTIGWLEHAVTLLEHYAQMSTRGWRHRALDVALCDAAIVRLRAAVATTDGTWRSSAW